jgi:hypothetical protein
MLTTALQEVNPSLLDDVSVRQTVAVGCSLVRAALGLSSPGSLWLVSPFRMQLNELVSTRRDVVVDMLVTVGARCSRDRSATDNT